VQTWHEEDIEVASNAATGNDFGYVRRIMEIMLITFLVGAGLRLTQSTPASWFGPAQATFQVQFGGNPFDPDENDVRVQFTGPSGPPIERLAYFDGAGYKAILVTPIKGLYKAVLYRNGKKMLEEPQEGLLDLTRPLEHGFVHPDPAHKNRFRWDDGTPYYPIGFNLGWQGAGPTMLDQLAKMGQNGINWSRIWSNHWDGKNPWWPQDDPKVPSGELWPKALDKWQGLVDQAERSGVDFQFVLFHHGAFSSKVNPNWPDQPWNAAKGGFLKDAGDFFTDTEAKRRSKMWLRYAVARYGASPSVLAWELFNEVEWVDARYENRWPDIETWHKEMADYIRTIDPYHHMITTSSATERPALYAAMDYYQPHTYPVDLASAVGGAVVPTDKPFFFGEFGPAESNRPAVQSGIRDAIYAALTANHAGSAMYWSWDQVEPLNLYPDFKNASEVIHLSEIAKHPNARQLKLKVETLEAGDLTFSPGAGWNPMEHSTFAIPDDLTPANLSKLPSFFQSMEGGHKDMNAGPITLKVNAKQPGKLSIALAEIAASGAELRIFVNDKLSKTVPFPSQAKDYQPSGAIEVPYPAGSVVLRIENHGADWVRLNSFTLTNAGSQAKAMGTGESDWMIIRLTATSGTANPTGTVTGLSIGDGTYNLTRLDLESGDVSNSTVQVQNFALPSMKLQGKDQVLIFKRKL